MNNIKLMYTTSFLQGLVFYAPVSLLFRIERGLSATEFFFLDFLTLIVMVSLEVPWGYFADRYGYKKTLIISYSMFFISRILLLFSNNFYMFLFQAIIVGISVAGSSGCDVAYLYESCKDENKEKVFGRYKMFSSVAFLISSLLSFMILKISMEFAIFLTIISYGLSIIMIVFTTDNKNYLIRNKNNKINKTKFRDNFKDIGLLKYTLLFVISITLISEVSYGININIGQIHLQNIGFNTIYLGIIGILSECIGLFSAKVYILSNKFGQLKTIKFMISIMITSVFILIFTKSILISIICISLLGGFMGIIYPIVTDIQNENIKENRATVLSIYSMIGNLIGSIVSMSVGMLIDINIKYSFIGCFIVMIVAIIGIEMYINNRRI